MKKIRLRKIVWLSLLIGLFGWTIIPVVEAQPRERRTDVERVRRAERPERGERPEIDVAQMRQRGAERIQRLLGVSDDEWGVIEPLIDRVQELTRQAQGGMVGRVRDAEDMPAAARAARELRVLLADEDATATQIEEKLSELRSAREEAAKKLESAQAALRELLTQRQEALLVMRGLLD